MYGQIWGAIKYMTGEYSKMNSDVRYKSMSRLSSPPATIGVEVRPASSKVSLMK